MITLSACDLVQPLADMRSLFGDDNRLPGVFLTSAPGRLYLHCISGPVSLRAEIEAEGELLEEAHKETPVRVHLVLLKQAVNALCNMDCMDKLTLSATDQGHLLLRHKRTRIRLEDVDPGYILPHHDWPEHGTPVEMTPRLLHALSMIMRAADDTLDGHPRPLHCVRLSPEDGFTGRMVMEALNGHVYRRAVVDAPLWCALLPQEGILVSRRAPDMLWNLLSRFLCVPMPSATLTKSNLFLSVPGLCLRMDMCKADWIDTDEFRAKGAGGASTIVCKSGALHDALRVMDVVGNEAARAVLLTKSGKRTLRLRGGRQTNPGRAEAEIHAFWTGPDDTPPPVDSIAFPTSCLLDWLRDCPSVAKVSIRLSSEKGPSLFTCEAYPDYETIIMPMKVVDNDWFEEGWE